LDKPTNRLAGFKREKKNKVRFRSREDTALPVHEFTESGQSAPFTAAYQWSRSAP
jgi:hypothetical protein